MLRATPRALSAVGEGDRYDGYEEPVSRPVLSRSRRSCSNASLVEESKPQCRRRLDLRRRGRDLAF